MLVFPKLLINAIPNAINSGQTEIKVTILVILFLNQPLIKCLHTVKAKSA